MHYLTQLRVVDKSRNMDTSRALAGLSALAQESRLKVFRLLVQRGPEGMAAGVAAGLQRSGIIAGGVVTRSGRNLVLVALHVDAPAQGGAA